MHLPWSRVTGDSIKIQATEAGSFDGAIPWSGKTASRVGGGGVQRVYRSVSLPARTLRALAAWRAQADGSLYCFIGEPRLATIRRQVDSGRWPENGAVYANLSRRWSKLQAAAGVALPRATIHDLRHVHTCECFRAGMSVGVVARRLGDDPAVVLRVYDSLRPDEGAESVALLERGAFKGALGAHEVIEPIKQAV